MFRNYFRIAVRNLTRYFGYSMINIFGLAIGMACCILILLWVQDEFSYDRYHKNVNDIYRVIQDINFTDHSTTWAITQGPLGPSLKNDFPEIVNAVRITDRGMRLSYGDRSFDEAVCMADASIFEMFTFPLIRGEESRALSDPHSIVLTEKMARKYFADENPLGKILKIDNRTDFIVSAVIEEMPRNSHFRYDFIVPFVYGRELNYSVDRWNNSQFTTYVQLQSGISYEPAVEKISGYLKDKPTIEKDARLNLQPLSRIHLFSTYEFDTPHGDITSVTIFSAIAFLVLLIACINFMNLATARSGNRAREVGMRKVAGAHRLDIIKQFFGESILLAFLALLLALILVYLALPGFNNLSAKELSINWTGNPMIFMLLAGIALLTGLISGSYPALFLSAFQPIKVLKSTPSGKSGSRFRKVLVVTQFSLTIILVISTVVIYRQLNFMRQKKLGYDREHMVYFSMRGEIRSKYSTFKSELLKNPNVKNVTASSRVPTYGYSFSNSLWRWEGQKSDEELLMRAVFVDEDYFKTFAMPLARGRSYSIEDFASDATDSIMVNETAVAAMGMTSPIGKKLSIGDDNFRIVGVVKDYHFRSLHEEIGPLILMFSPENSYILFARLNSAEISSTVAYMGKVFKRFAPGFPFNFRFLDDAVDAMYRSEKRSGTLFTLFSILAIFISCLGMFGLASFMAEKRTKEIGIRKVLGASVASIVILFSREFARWVLVANLIAWPIAFLGMNRMLQGFAYRTGIGLFTFLLSGLLALMIALLSVSYQSIRAARGNPITALRYE